MKVKNSLNAKNIKDNKDIVEAIEEDNVSDEEASNEEGVDEEQSDDSDCDGEQSDDSDCDQDEENESNESDEDLDASDTESDEDETDNEITKSENVISKVEKIKLQVLKKYQESHGKKLYIRFPRTISDEELVQKAKDLSPLIVNVHKPRQKYARFCLVDFESKENRDSTLKELKKRIKKGDLEKYQIDIPRTENTEYVQQLAERKIKSVEDKRVKARLKRASKKAETVQSFTSSVLVFNLPKTITVVQIRELFPSAVDVHIKTIKGGINKDKSIAAITLPSTMEARAAVKNKQLSLGGNQLTVKFDNQKIKKKNKKLKDEPKKKKEVQQQNPAEKESQANNGETPKTAITDTIANKKRKLAPTETENTAVKEKGKIISKNKNNKKVKH